MVKKFDEQGKMGRIDMYNHISKILGKTKKGLQGALAYGGKRPKKLQYDDIQTDESHPVSTAIEQHFASILQKEEFEKLSKFVEDSRGTIGWLELQEPGVVSINKGIIEGIYWKYNLKLTGSKIISLRKIKEVRGNLYCRDSVTLEDLGILEFVGGDCSLQNTKIKKMGRLKEVQGCLDCENMMWLESLGALETVGLTFTLTGTPVELQSKILKKMIEEKSFSLSHVIFGGKEGINKLLEQKTIPGSLNIIGMECDEQIKIIESIKRGILKIENHLSFGGNVKGIEKFLDISPIPGTLSLEGLPVYIQMEMFNKEDYGLLRVDGIELDRRGSELYSKLYTAEGLSLSNFRGRYGENINDIEDIDLKQEAEGILLGEYKKIQDKIIYESNKMKEENEGKQLTEEDKRKLREKIKELGEELIKIKEKIEGFGIEL